MVLHVLNRGVGRRVLFTKDDYFLAFERVVEETLRPDLVAAPFHLLGEGLEPPLSVRPGD